MPTIHNYSPPTTEQLDAFKAELGFTGAQMAELFALGGSHQWRKYTGGQSPRAMSVQMLFFGCAMLELPPEQIERVLARMRAAGAQFDYDEATER
ncbi:XRE family transcriptional regulator [Bordetella sp. 2513F-2]